VKKNSNQRDPLSPERIQEITRIVLTVLAEQEKTQAGRLSRAGDFITRYWVILSFLVLVLACFWYRANPFHEVKKIAREQEMRKFTWTMTERHRKLGKQFLDMGLNDAAREEFQEALKLDPTNVEAEFGLFKSRVFNLLQGEYNPEVIEKRLEILKAEKEDDPHVHLFLGDFYYTLEKDQEAEEQYRQAIKLDEKVASAYYGLGLIYDKQDKTDVALKMFEQAAGLSKGNRNYLNNLASLYSRKGQYEKAIKKYLEVIKLDPDYLLSYCEIAQALRLTGKIKEAYHIQLALAKRLDNEKTASLPKNQDPWYFIAGQDKEVKKISLQELPEKRCYVYYCCALTGYLYGYEPEAQGKARAVEEARQYLEKARQLKTEREPAVRSLVVSDLIRLAQEQPSWQGRLSQLRQEFPQFFPPNR
jgi:tetratricopeptide (TPR) repeat protein